jgi:hypothetical protein
MIETLCWFGRVTAAAATALVLCLGGAGEGLAARRRPKPAEPAKVKPEDGKAEGGRPWAEAWKVETKYYRVACNVSEAKCKAYGAYLDALCEHLSGFFRVRGRPPRMVVYVFRKREEFEGFSRSIGYTPRRTELGYYTRTGGFPFTATYRLNLYGWFATENVLAHECTHQFVDLAVPFRVPVWLNEGLAVYFESSEWDGKKLETGKMPKIRLASLKARIRKDADLPLKDVILAGRKEFTTQHYAAAWSLVHFLIHGDKNRYRESFNAYFLALQRGVPRLVAFEGTIGREFKSWEDLQERWRKYVLGLEADVDVPADPERH